MGARLGRWDIEGDPPMGSPTNAVVGLFMLWWGWFAFNAGSTFGNFEANTVLSNIIHSLYIKLIQVLNLWHYAYLYIY